MYYPFQTRVCFVTLFCAFALARAAQAQSDVTQPGDPAFASSANSPGSEGVANAIDNTQAKYLNFDTRTPANTPSGFAVSPSVGVTRVVGLTIQSANDGPERDPKTVLLEGSNDATITGFNTGTWEPITTISNITFTARFQTQTFFFDNFKPFRHYRWTVLEVATPNGCCMQVAEVELIGGTLPPDVTQPGDPLIASSANSPGSEGVANAIDNTQAKYLNFDTRTPANTPSGFIVTPAIGASLITGMNIQAANDAPERDPKTVLLEGSNDASVSTFSGGNWEVITTISNIPPFTARFQTQTFLFDNFKPYKHYRWTVLEVATPNGCCMQVAEVELLGTGAPKDVTQPGDALIASSANSPGSEGVANAIDNTQAKYLNFDTRTPANTPSGFIVTPSIGASAVIGMTIQSANDAPERDPKTILLEGSNDATLTNFNSGNWEVVTVLSNIPPFTARFQTQSFYFPNKKSFKHYRWTVLEVATPNGCCMQVAEVELLAATQSNPCGQTEFLEQPIDTPVLEGSTATFLSKVNGPWTLQWLRNGVAIPGATLSSYTTPPVTTQTATNTYAVAIVGCQTSQVVRATIFTPSATKSIGISFRGGGANGAPTDVLTNDIIGIQQQAFWNNAASSSGLLNTLTDSDNSASTITVDFLASGAWGAGTAVDSSTDRMLNGLIVASPGAPGSITFNNVPDGLHTILIYVVSPPLQFQNITYSAAGVNTNTYYIRALNSDEYKPAPGFYRGTSTNPANPSIANFVRFDNVRPTNGTIVVTFDTTTTGYDRGTGVNGIQLVLNAPSAGAPPAITMDPQPTVAPSNGVATVSVEATGSNLTYQWRKNGRNLFNGGNVSGANSPTLTINSFSADDVGIYSVAVFNPAGSVISKNASVRLSQFNIRDAMVGHWRLDETSGAIAANSATPSQPALITGTVNWVPGIISNAFQFNGSTYMFVSNYTKATKQIAASAWVNIPAGSASADIAIIRNAEGALTVSGGGQRIVGQFELGLVYDATAGSLTPMAAIGIGPNVARVNGTTPFPTGGWHYIAFTADGAQLRLYVDGQEVGRGDYLADINPPDIQWLSIGARLLTDTNTTPATVSPDGTTPNYMIGGTDDIALWIRALTADEVLKVYQAGQQNKSVTTVVVTPPPPRLTITRNGSNVTLTWEGTGFRLQSASALGSPTAWADVSGAASGYTTSSATGTKFYRLIK